MTPGEVNPSQDPVWLSYCPILSICPKRTISKARTQTLATVTCPKARNSRKKSRKQTFSGQMPNNRLK
ncbi:MAG: hypothetical protein LBF22_09295 [Deltaproteobacteria bacterium]|nr:hypothetical protein [Deltaproteobacteria bacterium]